MHVASKSSSIKLIYEGYLTFPSDEGRHAFARTFA